MTRFLLLAALLFAAGGVRTIRAQDAIDRRVPASPGGQVAVHNTAGTVEVIGWERSEIHITGTLGAGAQELEVTNRGDRVEIRVVLPRRARNVQGTDLTVHMPSRSRLSVGTVSADIGVAGLRTPVELATVSGDVATEGLTAGLSVQTVSGDIDLSGGGGNVEISTVSGDAVLVGQRFRAVRFESVSGNLRLNGLLDARGASTLTTHSGDIDLAIPTGSDLAFDISTFSGDISNAFGPTAEKTSRYGPGSSLRFTLGTGAAQLRISTFSGDVQLQRP